MAFPATLTSYTNPVGTNTQDSPDHASQHTVINTVVGTIESMLGTSSGGTNIFARRNNETFGTPAITGGTVNNTTLGTATVAGTIVLPSTVIPTAALVNNAVTNGTLLFSGANNAATVTTAWAQISGTQGTLVTTGGMLFGGFTIVSYTPDTERNSNFRLLGTSSAGTFYIPEVNGFKDRFATNVQKVSGAMGVASGVVAGTYICIIQGSSSGTQVANSDGGVTASIIELKK